MKATFENRDYQRTGGGIDGLKWDCDVPPLSARHEQFRVLKPGGYFLCFTGNKNLHLVMCTLAKAGFEIVELLAWVHGNGVPKSICLDDKLGADPDLVRYIGGRTNLSPSMEIMVLARKPMTDKNAIGNQKKYGVGLLNIKESRFDGAQKDFYPKNVILEKSTDVLAHAGKMANRFYQADADFNELEVIQSFFVGRSLKEKELGLENKTAPYSKKHLYSDKIVKTKNPHQTVKPITLMQYLVRMLTFEGDIILDAYAGSGTTGIACLLENRKFIGAEQDKEFFETAQTRLFAFYISRQKEILESHRDELICIYDKKIRSSESDMQKQKLLRELRLKVALVEQKIKPPRQVA